MRLSSGNEDPVCVTHQDRRRLRALSTIHNRSDRGAAHITPLCEIIDSLKGTRGVFHSVTLRVFNQQSGICDASFSGGT